MTPQPSGLRPIDRRGARAAFWLLFAAGVKCASVLMFATMIALLADPGNLPLDVAGVWSFIAGAAILIIGGFLLSMVFVAHWIHRASVNAHALSKGMDISPGWAVGWYFVPFANLAMPFRAMDEIWRVSHDPEGWRETSSVPLLRWWWALWLAASFAGAVSSLVSRGSTGASGVILQSILGMVSAACAVGAALLLRRIVLRITALQSRRLSAEVF